MVEDGWPLPRFTLVRVGAQVAEFAPHLTRGAAGGDSDLVAQRRANRSMAAQHAALAAGFISRPEIA